MRCSTKQPPCSCGIDVPARSMYVCLVSQDGAILLHRHMQAAPAPCLKAMAPYRDGLVVAVAWSFTWDGLADLCAEPDMPFVLGHALSRKALHGGKAKNDKIDSHKLALLRRGGMLPKAAGSPAARRATRALLRRRRHLMRHRADLLAHVPKTNRQSNRPELGKQLADKAHRTDGAERLAEPAVHKTREVDLALIPSDDELLKALARSRLHTATRHEAQSRSGLHTVPGIGHMLRLVLR